MIVLAEDFSGFQGVSLVLLIASIAASAAWFVIFAWRWLATRPKLPETGLEARDAGSEAPALVNLLVNRWHLTRASVQATLMDLASRKHIAIDMYGQDQFVVRIRRDAPEEKVTPYERQLLDLDSGTASSALRSATGAYKVTFPVDVSDCANLVTPGIVGVDTGPVGFTYVATQAEAFGDNVIHVGFVNHQSNSIDTGFHMAVIC